MSGFCTKTTMIDGTDVHFHSKLLYGSGTLVCKTGTPNRIAQRTVANTEGDVYLLRDVLERDKPELIRRGWQAYSLQNGSVGMCSVPDIFRGFTSYFLQFNSHIEPFFQVPSLVRFSIFHS